MGKSRSSQDSPDPELYEKAKNNPRLEPFLHSFYKKSLYEKFKSYIFPGPILVALRLLFIVVCLTIHHIFQHIVFLGFSDWDHPAPKWRRCASHFFTGLWTRIGMFGVGFYRLKFIDHTKEKKNEDDSSGPPFDYDQPYPLVGCHMTLLDIIVCSTFLRNPSFVAKSEMWKTPLISFMVKCFRCLKIVRKKQEVTENNTPAGNKEPTSVEILVGRIKNPQPNEYTPLIFPEGTTGSGRYVFRFHRGAFIAGKPIRPFTIKYPGKHASICYDSISIKKLLYDLASQYINYAELEVYDVYYPSPEEQRDVGLYARNVGKFIASKLGVKYLNNCDIKESNLLADYFNMKLTYAEVEEQLARIEAARIAEDGGLFDD